MIKKLKMKNSNKYVSSSCNYKGVNRYFVPSNISWSNVIYNFDKKTLKSTFILDKFLNNIIKIYINMFNNTSDNKTILNKIPYKKKFYSNRKVWVGKTEVKHYNNKVVITLYIYDRMYNIINNKLNKIFNKFKYLKNKYLFFKSNIIRHLEINTYNLHNILHSYNNKNLKLEDINNNNIFKNINTYSRLLLSKLNNNNLIQETIANKLLNFIEINSFKYKTLFISKLQKIISKLYGKETEINIVLLRNYYLDSDIFTQILIDKVENRGRIDNKFNKLLFDVKTSKYRKGIINRVKNNKIKQNFNLKNLFNKNLTYIIKNYHVNAFTKVENNIFNDLSNKTIIGVKLIGAGRLSRKTSTDRSKKYTKYSGTLKNINSSYKGLSTQIVRNVISNNKQYTSISGRDSAGSFGIRGWVNSM